MPLEGLHERYINFYTDFAFKKLFVNLLNISIVCKAFAILHGKRTLRPGVPTN